jgi:hypothetical protein
MVKKLMLLLYGLFGMLLFSACNSAGGPAPTPVLSAAPQVAVENKVLPTPVSPGQKIVYNGLQVAMSQAEITSSYLTEYGSTREPPAGEKFLWIHIILQNIGQNEQNLPAPEHFSVLYGTSEFKSTYGHHKGYMDYTALKTVVYQGEEVNAWLRFDIPADAELKDLQFAFLPESSQVSFGFSSNDYPWGDHPIYLWTCTP